jgi:predicted RNA binding protein YcfA (HicA-like mRNA interferase family)
VPWTAQDLVHLLLEHGATLRRHGAKHDLYTIPGVLRPISVPRHRGDVAEGTARSILRQAGIRPGDPEDAG